MRRLLLLVTYIFVSACLFVGCSKTEEEDFPPTYVHQDTLLIDSVVYDTIIVDSTVYDTIIVDSVVFDTVIIDSVVLDTTYIHETIYDTIIVDSVVYDTIVTYGFSVLGNSISTYSGMIPKGYPSYYSTSRMALDDTWWMRFSSLSGIPLNSNASWSGSTVSSTYGTADSWFFSDRRIDDLSLSGTPKYIFILGGTNDWNAGRSELGESISDMDTSTFTGAYSCLIYKLRNKYPFTKIYCCSILPRKQGMNKKNAKEWTVADANQRIAAIADYYDAFYVDLTDCGIADNFNAYTLDGLHPNSAGMELVSNCLFSKFKSSYY